MSYELRLSATAKRKLTTGLPEKVAAAAWEFINGPLRENPARLSRQLRPPLERYRAARRGTYRVVLELDEPGGFITVIDVEHRSDVYRPH